MYLTFTNRLNKIGDLYATGELIFQKKTKYYLIRLLLN